MRIAGRAFLLVVALTVMSPLVSAYYYYVFFANGTAPYAPLPAHFDLNAIKDNTVQYFISDQAPAPLVDVEQQSNPGDCEPGEKSDKEGFVQGVCPWGGQLRDASGENFAGRWLEHGFHS